MGPSDRWRGWWASLALCAVVGSACPADTTPTPPAGELNRAIERGRAFLVSRLSDQGPGLDEPAPSTPRYGSATALSAYALLSAGAEPNVTLELRSALDWLIGAELSGTLPIAWRTLALSQVGYPAARQRLKADTAWLIRSAGSEGTYSAAGPGDPNVYDNDHTQLAAWALHEAGQAGIEIPQAYWQRMERHWLNEQQLDGGWGYRLLPGTLQARTYGSITASGLATLYICQQHLHADQYIRCRSADDPEPIRRAHHWLDEQFTVEGNPGKGIEWRTRWLHAVGRVAAASGRRRIGGRDWYAQGARALLDRQNPDGSWGYGDRVVETSFAMLFLTRGRSPLILSKLRWPGKWNARPRDAANWASWMSRALERPLGWQVVDVSAPVSDWLEAPLLYLSGAGPIHLSEATGEKLRRYVHRGGLIVSESACNNGDFTLDIRKLTARLFPNARSIRLPADHPLHQIMFPRRQDPGLVAMTNGVRLLAVHAPRELSLDLQLGPGPTRRAGFEVLGNLAMFAVDKTPLPPRGQTTWPAPPQRPPPTTLRIARVKYPGNWNPEPAGWQRLTILAARRLGIGLDVAEVELAQLDPADRRLAVMTGTAPPAWTDRQQADLRRFLRGGGRLIVDAAGGSEAFAQWMTRRLPPLLGAPLAQVLPVSHPLYTQGKVTVDRVGYRRQLAIALGPDRRRPRLLGAAGPGGGLGLILSREDLTAGIAGIRQHGIAGYDIPSAERVMLAALLYAHRTEYVDTRIVPAGQ